MKRNFVILITALILPGLLNLTSASFAQQPIPKGGKWEKKADIPTPRIEFATAAVGGLIYAFGGWDGKGALASVEVYNPATDKWEKRGDMPIPIRWHGSALIDGKVYLFSGRTVVDRRGKKIEKSLKTTYVYDPAADAWEEKGEAPVARSRMGTALLGGKVYLAGGITNVGGGGQLLEAYDPATNTWEARAQLIEPRWAPTAAAVNGKLYAIGGFRKEETWHNSIEEYDPAANVWTKKADMPTPRRELSPTSPVVNGKIYVIGGDNNNALSRDVEAYDPATDTWEQLSKMRTLRQSLCTIAVRGKIYAIGGGNRGGQGNFGDPPEGTQVFGDVEEYTPEGWPFAVFPEGKIATTWGTIKTTDE
jgi:N-acetylneuraminic acid mutarotase